MTISEEHDAQSSAAVQCSLITKDAVTVEVTNFAKAERVVQRIENVVPAERAANVLRITQG